MLLASHLKIDENNYIRATISNSYCKLTMSTINLSHPITIPQGSTKLNMYVNLNISTSATVCPQLEKQIFESVLTVIAPYFQPRTLAPKNEANKPLAHTIPILKITKDHIKVDLSLAIDQLSSNLQALGMPETTEVIRLQANIPVTYHHLTVTVSGNEFTETLYFQPESQEVSVSSHLNFYLERLADELEATLIEEYMGTRATWESFIQSSTHLELLVCGNTQILAKVPARLIVFGGMVHSVRRDERALRSKNG